MNIALVTEGVSEHRVVKSFINKYLKDDEDDVFVNQIQPEVEDDRQVNGGGWHEVLRFCASGERINEVFRFNEVLVIQIDTDLCQTVPFSIEHSLNGKVKSQEALYNEVKLRLIDEFPPDIYEKFKNRIVFAITIHTIECWLLPIYAMTKSKEYAVNKCLSALNRGLSKRNMDVIPNAKNSPNGIKAYNGLLKKIKRKDILVCSDVYFGLNRFLVDLDAVDRTTIVDDDDTALE